MPLPATQITEIKINDELAENLRCAKDASVTNVGEIQRIQLPYTENTVSFDFVAMEYSDPSKNQYRYKMKGVDHDWVHSGTNGFARYSNLRPGKYIFNVQGSNSDGYFGPVRALAVVIKPPFYLTPWFILLCVMLTSGSIWLIGYTVRKRREKIQRLIYEKKLALEQERLRIARDMHDDLGSGLSALSLRSKIILQKNTDSNLEEEIQKIVRLSDELSQKVRETIWAVDVKNDSLEKLMVYLHKYAISLFELVNTTCSVSLPDKIQHITVSGNHRRMVFLAYKEALNNITKYANATEVVVNMDMQGTFFLVSIYDNGIGFDPQLLENSTGKGLRNMRQRMTEVGGTCQISTSDQGTSVLLTVPIINM